ncbi:hypothetical protein IT396_01330, partial [Candidatus Nomurabacteria bacterium]|nr:hypothetical protein [Candidatus Nomurabacteria bacterium]
AGQYIIGSGLTITNTGVTSLAGTANQITASAATGAITLSLPDHVIFPGTFQASAASTTNATSTNLTVTGIASTTALYISNVVADSILKTTTGGLVTAAIAGTDYENALTFSYPLVRTTNTISLAFGTTTSNTWAGTQTFTNAPVLTGFSGVVAANSGTTYSTATGTVTGSSQVSVTAGQSVIGSGLTIDIVGDSIGDTQLAFNTGQNLTTASAPTFSALTVTNALTSGSFVTGNATTTNATTTNLAVSGLASTTNLIVSALAQAGTQCVTSNSSGLLSLQTCADFSYPFPSNATSTLLTFSGGLMSTASTTIGNGTQTGGLTVSGAATTTGTLNVGYSASTGWESLTIHHNATNGGGYFVQRDGNEKFVALSAFDATTERSLTFGGGNWDVQDVNKIYFYTDPTYSGGVNEGVARMYISPEGGIAIGSGYSTVDAGTNNVLIEGTVGIGTTTPYSKLTVWGTTSLFEAVNNSSTTIFSIGQGGATTTALSVSGTASTTNLIVSSLGSAGTQCVQVNAVGLLSGAGAACGSGSGSGDSSWEFFNTSGIRLATTSNQVLIGGFATSSSVALLEVAGGNILHIASSSPSLATTSASASKTYDVAVVGRLAYLADFDTGLRIIDVSNPKLTATVGTYSTGLDNTVSVAVANNYAFIGDEFAGIKILDVANPASPVLVGSYSDITGPYDLEVSGKYLFAVDLNDDELHIIDISDPANPAVAAVYTSGLLAPYGVAVYGRYAYVASQDNGDIVVVDISNPKSPALAGTYAGDGAPAALYVSGKYLYVADAGAGFYILDVSNPTSPSLVSGSTYDALGAYYGVQVAGNYAYITEHAGTLRVLNVANPESVSLVGSYSTGGAPWNVTVSGKYAYVAADASGLKVVDINGIETPSAHIGAIETNTANVSDALTVGGDITANGALSVGISGIFSRGTIAAYVASSTQVNPMAATFMGGNVGVGTTTAYSKLTAWGSGSVFEAVNSASTTIFSVGQSGATTTSFAITDVLSGLLKTDSAGNVVAAVGGVDYADFGYLFPSNATTTVLNFNGGLTSYASTTIGAGTQAGGLTISGGATTTGNAYFANKVGIGTTSPFATFSIHAGAGQNSFAIGSSSSSYFIVNSTGRVGIGTTTPSSRLAITDTVSEAQFTLAYDATRYATLQTNASGNLVVHASNGGASGGGIILSDDNLWVCQSGSCPSITPVDTSGNLFVENSVYIGADGHHLRQISATELGLYNGDNELIVTFDEGL